MNCYAFYFYLYAIHNLGTIRFVFYIFSVSVSLSSSKVGDLFRYWKTTERIIHTCPRRRHCQLGMRYAQLSADFFEQIPDICGCIIACFCLFNHD
jgi:hypothetical protein